ncbi:hypothetical protein BJ944DRAFT_245359 [Cunninghamella echinulata]|nr:hypothetical protein BJ944DRAFT_245359 [Cunninghamella echinulata]
MKNFCLLFLFFIFYPTSIFARRQISPLLSACHGASEKYLFSHCTKRVYAEPECLCNSHAYIGSLATCVEEYSFGDIKEQSKAWTFMDFFCPTSNLLANQIPYQDILNNATNDVTWHVE